MGKLWPGIRKRQGDAITNETMHLAGRFQPASIQTGTRGGVFQSFQPLTQFFCLAIKRVQHPFHLFRLAPVLIHFEPVWQQTHLVQQGFPARVSVQTSEKPIAQQCGQATTT